MRTPSFFSLFWPWAIIILLLGSCPAAYAATATWTQDQDAEQLVLRFDFRLLETTPRKKKSALLLPVRWSFWQRERKPKPVDFSSSALLEHITITQEGIEIATQSADFTFTVTTRPKTKELVLIFRAPAITAAQQANATSEQNATSEEATAPLSNASHAAPTDLEILPSTVILDANATGEINATNASYKIEEVAPFVPPASDEDPGPGKSSLRTKVTRQERASQATPWPASEEPGSFRVRQAITRDTPMPDNATMSEHSFVPENASAQNNSAPEAMPEISTMDAHIDMDADTAPSQDAIPADLPHEDAAPDSPVYPAHGADISDETQDTRADATHNASAASVPADTREDNSTAFFLDNETEENATLASQHHDYEPAFAAFQDALASGNVEATRLAMIPLLQAPVPSAMREAVLYGWADLLMRNSRGASGADFRAIEEAYLMAMNHDLRSPRMPEVLHDLGYLHLTAGNGPEARAYLGLLRKRYPDDPHTPMADLYLGQYYIDRGNYQKAADYFQYVMQKYPQSEFIAPATIGLFKCMLELKYTDKAFEMLNEMEQRWPASALRDPQFLLTAGLVSLQHNQLDRAKEYFWRYYNIFPKAEQRNTALAHIGDILLSQGQHAGAREVYEQILADFPGTDAALVALMRLAEEGILDETNPRDANSPYPERHPQKIYERILRDPDSPLAPIARLKLAMWHYNDKNYARALSEAEQFLRDYPRHELVPKAREVGDQAMFDWIAQGMQEQDFAGVISAWNQHGQWFGEQGPEQSLRLAIASAFFRENKTEQAVELARPFVFGDLPHTEFSEQAMDLLLSTAVEGQDWPGVLDIAQHVRAWPLAQTRQRQVDYAAALAHENLGQYAQAKSLWSKLSTDLELGEEQRTYALYFLARTAMADGDAEQADIIGQEALAALQKSNTDTAKMKEMLDMLSRIAESRGRISDALAWANEYEGFVREDDGEWPALTYRKALLFRKNNDLAQWRTLLEHIIAKAPTSLYSRMASTELESIRLEQELGKIR